MAKDWESLTRKEKVQGVVGLLVLGVVAIAIVGAVFGSDGSDVPQQDNEVASSEILSTEDRIKQLVTRAATEGDGLADEVREVTIIDELDGSYSVNVIFFENSGKRRLIEQTMANVYLELFTSENSLSNVTVAAKNEYRNEFGDTKEIIVYQTHLTSEVAEKINFDTDKAVLQIEIIPGLWETQKLHADLQKQ